MRQVLKDHNLSTILYCIDKGESLAQVGRHYDVTRQAISHYLKRNGIKYKRKLKTIGCKKCTITPFARDMCRACYCLWRHRRRGKPVKRKHKPIGCELCTTKPYCKGLCRNCYARKQYHHKD